MRSGTLRRRVAALLAPVIVLIAIGVEAKSKQPRVDVVRPSILDRGGSTELTLSGKNLSRITGARVEPSEGVSAGSLRAVSKKESTLVLEVAADAQPGERKLTLTGDGFEEQRTLFVKHPVHDVAIRELEVLSTDSKGARVEFQVLVEDEAGDFGGYFIGTLLCGGSPIYLHANQSEGLEATEEPGVWKLHATISGIGSFSLGRRSDCMIEIGVTDRSGYRSPKLKAQARFD